MAAATNPGLRWGLAAVLIAALTLAGLGRALATAVPIADAAVAGVPICHSGGGAAPNGVPPPAPHACCDDGALSSAAVLPAPPSLAAPAPAAHLAVPARGTAWTLAAAPARGHSLPRGPPAA